MLPSPQCLHSANDSWKCIFKEEEKAERSPVCGCGLLLSLIEFLLQEAVEPANRKWQYGCDLFMMLNE